MNVAGPNLVGIADQEIDVTDHRGLIDQVPHVGGELIVRWFRPLNLNEPLGPCGEPLDQSLDFVLFRILDGHVTAVCVCDVIQPVEQGIGCYGDDQRAVTVCGLGTHAVVQQVLSSQTLGQGQFTTCHLPPLPRRSAIVCHLKR
jgi:hypothetical protein